MCAIVVAVGREALGQLRNAQLLHQGLPGLAVLQQRQAGQWQAAPLPAGICRFNLQTTTSCTRTPRMPCGAHARTAPGASLATKAALLLPQACCPDRCPHAGSPAHLKLPSMPDTSMALTIMRVRRKGTFSGNFSRCMLASKQSPKSMCSSLPAGAAQAWGQACQGRPARVDAGNWAGRWPSCWHDACPDRARAHQLPPLLSINPGYTQHKHQHTEAMAARMHGLGC